MALKTKCLGLSLNDVEEVIVNLEGTLKSVQTPLLWI